MKTTEPQIITEVDLKSSTLTQVWSAITQVEKMQQWYFPQLVSFEAQVGFKTSFVIEMESRTFTHRWQVLEVKPNELLSYRWQYEEYPGDSTVTFVLRKRGNGVTLTVTTQILQDFPAEIPEFKRESAVEGWSYLIGTSLNQYLEVGQ